MLIETGQITHLHEARVDSAAARPTLPARSGFDTDVPWGGANKNNPGGDYPDGRQDYMSALYQAYVGCPWLAAPIDVIARTVTAGGLGVEPVADSIDPADDPQDQRDPKKQRDGGAKKKAGKNAAKRPGKAADGSPLPPPSVQALQSLLDYCNPTMDIIQLLRGAVVDLCVYGDAFIEVVWLLGRPVALYPLDPASIVVNADEHGVITGYTQVVDAREATFDPHEVIHISMDAPKGQLYGMGIAQKAMLPVTIWLFTAATLKETMRKGDPPHLHMDFPLEVQPDEVRAWRGRYAVQNIGTANIGTPITTRGGVKPTELQLGKLADYLAIQDKCRDTILSVAGVPPSKVGVIESGNLGGGTGTSQDKTFRVNTCGPIASIVLEKLNFHLTREAFGIEDWEIKFEVVDWRDDEVVEQIRDMRLRNGSWTLNDYLIDIDKPPAGPEGDVHVLVDRQNIVLWSQIADLSTAKIDALKPKPAAPPPAPGEQPEDQKPGEEPPAPPKGKAGKGGPDDKTEQQAESLWRSRVLEVYRRRLLQDDDGEAA
jgi:hypothetical protein